ncbi:GPW/gp25 family protein [Crossiella cryophila]|uniref:Phage baseplate assembly protein W n=1 Tax=Crossiella cryophila TaxID=43355 RepID=A0A7W7CE77_9PSEU|nr:GPW/gp25 family protein [Crossiella cryophila]MBB4677914.1 phage baseplate assembly protein W [Crossiella cryophila]
MYVDFPYQIDHRGRTAETSHPDHVRDLIEQLLFTTPGERVNRPDFGCGLLELVFAPNSPELAATLQASTQAALQRYLGDVLTVIELTVLAEESTISVTLRYRLLSTGEIQTETIEGSVTP